MDYSKLSDFEINRLVAIAEGHKCYYGDGSYTNDGVNVTVKGNRRIGWFNPCREGDTAWQIIRDNEINILWNWNEEGLHGATASPLYEYEHENVLRAAMTVFLMMQESKIVPANSTGSDLR